MHHVLLESFHLLRYRYVTYDFIYALQCSLIHFWGRADPKRDSVKTKPTIRSDKSCQQSRFLVLRHLLETTIGFELFSCNCDKLNFLQDTYFSRGTASLTFLAHFFNVTPDYISTSFLVSCNLLISTACFSVKSALSCRRSESRSSRTPTTIGSRIKSDYHSCILQPTDKDPE